MQRFREQAEKLSEMRRTVELLARTLANQELVSEAGKDVLRVINDYAYALTLLDRYDHGTLVIEGTTPQALHRREPARRKRHHSQSNCKPYQSQERLTTT